MKQKKAKSKKPQAELQRLVMNEAWATARIDEYVKSISLLHAFRERIRESIYQETK